LVDTCVDRCPDFTDHLLDRHDLFARYVAASFRDNLVLQVNGSDTSALIGLNRAAHIEDTAIASVGVSAANGAVRFLWLSNMRRRTGVASSVAFPTAPFP
jgi:hypothetical protein